LDTCLFFQYFSFAYPHEYFWIQNIRENNNKIFGVFVLGAIL
jgi:hypothetical protein